MIITALKDFEKWNKILNVFKKINLIDIYFDLEFHKINSINNKNILAFIYEEKNDYFFLPFIVNKIKNIDFFDFETIMGYSGPISTNNSSNFLKKCWSLFNHELKEKKIVAGLIRFNPYLKNHLYFLEKENYELSKIKKTVYINFKKNSFINNYSKEVIRNLNKAKKNSLKTEKKQTKENYEIFYNIYQNQMKLKKAETRFSFNKKYFFDLLNKFPNNSKLILAKKNNEILGGIIGIYLNKICNIHLSAYTKTGLSLGVAYFLRHELIMDFNNKVDIVHFGGGNSNEENDSLYLYKKKFSKDYYDFYIGKIIVDNNIYNKLINDWDLNNKIEKFNNYFLRYRY